MSDILKRGFGDPTPDKTPGGSTSGKRAASAIQDKTRRPSLASMDATVIVQGPMGNRRIPFTDFHPLIRSRISAWESCASVKGLRRSAVAALGQPAFASSIRGSSRHDLAWGAEPALESVMLDERCLKRMEIPVPLQSFDGRDPLAFLHRDVHCACAALAAITALLRTG
jgi:hypothetical protein